MVVTQANMLLDGSGNLVIADLGGAQTGIRRGERTDEMSPQVTTTAYQPPEVFHGKLKFACMNFQHEMLNLYEV